MTTYLERYTRYILQLCSIHGKVESNVSISGSIPHLLLEQSNLLKFRFPQGRRGAWGKWLPLLYQNQVLGDKIYLLYHLQRVKDTDSPTSDCCTLGENVHSTGGTYPRWRWQYEKQRHVYPSISMSIFMMNINARHFVDVYLIWLLMWNNPISCTLKCKREDLFEVYDATYFF